MCAVPVGNIRPGRRFSDEEKNDDTFISAAAEIPFCTEDHSILIRFGGSCETCGKTWNLMDMRSE